MNILESTSFGNALNILGIILTLIAFGITFREARKSKSAAEAATAAVKRVREDLKKFDATADLSKAISVIDEIKSLHRRKDLKGLPEKYALVREILISIQAENKSLSEKHQIAIQNSIIQLRTNEDAIDRAIQLKEQIDVIQLLNIVGQEQDILREILFTFRNKIGED